MEESDEPITVRRRRKARPARRRIRLLEPLARWIWSPGDDPFHEALPALETYVCRKGHAAVPEHP